MVWNYPTAILIYFDILFRNQEYRNTLYKKFLKDQRYDVDLDKIVTF